MGKPKHSKSKYVSKGERKSVKQKTLNSMRRDYLSSGERLSNQLIAHRSGKKTMVTIENPNKEETNKRFIRVPGSQYFKEIYSR